MATWKRILVEDDIVGEGPISITDGVVSIVNPSELSPNPENDDTDALLVYDSTAQAWTSLTLQGLFSFLTELLAQSQIDAGGSTSVFQPDGVLGDLDGDGAVSVNDMLLFFQAYGTSGSVDTSYYYTNSLVSFTTWSTQEYKKLQVDTTGTASSSIVTVSVDGTAETIEFSGIPATANVPLYISITPTVFAAWGASFAYRVIVKTWDQNNTPMLDDVEYGLGGTQIASSQLYGINIDANPATYTLSALQLKNNIPTNSAPSKIRVYFECLLAAPGQTNADTHKAKIKDLTINYL